MAIPKANIAATTAINSKKVAVSSLSSVATAAIPTKAEVLASITENVSSIREASTVLSGSKLKSELFSNMRSSGVDRGKGESAMQRMINSNMSPGFDEGRVSGGHVSADPSADPKDAPGTGWYSYSQNQKDTEGAMSAGATAGAVVAGAIGVVGALASAPVVVAASAGATIGFAIFAGYTAVLEKKDNPFRMTLPARFPALLWAKTV
jgi:hypothetical protein